MATPLALLESIGKALLHGAGDSTFSVPLLADAVWLSWGDQRDELARRAEFLALAWAPPHEVRRVVVQAVKQVAAGQPREVRQAVATYLGRVPAAIKRRLPNSSDGAGLPAQLTLTLRTAADLVPCLPAELPTLPASVVAEQMRTLSQANPAEITGTSREPSGAATQGPARLAGPTSITLRVTAGPHQGQTFCFAGHDTFLVGRSKHAHFRLPEKDKYFSRIHFLVEVNPPHCRLLDMGSHNGTYVNDQKVTVADLHDGDKIRAGRTLLRVTVAGTDVEWQPTPYAPSVETLIVPTSTPAHTPQPALPSASALNKAATPRQKLPKSFEISDVSRVQPTPPASALKSAATPGPLRGPSSQPARPPASAALHCRACALPLLPAAANSPLCPACQALARDQPQPIAGYEIIRALGKGGMGVVWLALRLADASVVAIKTIVPAMAGTATQVERFLREARILQELNHPHIVAFREMGESGEQLYFAMEFVGGTDAYHLVRDQGPLPVKRAVRLVCQMLEALEFAHARGFVHRDIKPGNLLVTQEDGRETVKLADFGLARVYQVSEMSGLTLIGDIGGTLPFMAPEQVTHYRDARPPADQYAAAATLYNLLTGCLIHDFPKDFRDQLVLIMQEKPVPIRSRRPEIPEALAEAIHRALAREPDDRFADVRSLRLAVSKFCR